MFQTEKDKLKIYVKNILIHIIKNPSINLESSLLSDIYFTTYKKKLSCI